MAKALLTLLAGVLLAACSGQGAAPSPAPSAQPSSSPPAALTVRAPLDDILTAGDVGLDRTGGRDHLGITQAAEEQQNQPLALTRYRAWGWVDEASRSWGGGSAQVTESLLLLTKVDGARLAFFDRAADLHPGCPARLALDDCAEGRNGSTASLAGRVGPYVFRLDGPGVDLEALAARQAARIRA